MESTLATKIIIDKGAKCLKCKKPFVDEDTLKLHVSKTGTIKLIHSRCAQ